MNIVMNTWESQKSYWFESADYDFQTAELLFSSSKYSWSLFIGHLVLEKL